MSAKENPASQQRASYLRNEGYPARQTSFNIQDTRDEDTIQGEFSESASPGDLRLGNNDEIEEQIGSETSKDQSSYSVAAIFSDFFLEYASGLVSAKTIKYRLRLFLRFLDYQIDAGLMSEPILSDDIDATTLDRFRLWAAHYDIPDRKATTGFRTVKRAPSGIEESVKHCKTALYYAYDRNRIKNPPLFKVRSLKAYSPTSTARMSVGDIGELLAYTVQGKESDSFQAWKLHALRRHLIAAICTVARPSTIADMNVSPARRQWSRLDGVFNLNREGRMQNNKMRPIIPVVKTLEEWLETTENWFVCQEVYEKHESGERVMVQRPTTSTAPTFKNAVKNIGMPVDWSIGRLRHSMAAELRKRGVNPWELAGFMGHKLLDMTEIYAVYDPSYLATVAAGIDDIIADLKKIPGCADALSATFRPKSSSLSWSQAIQAHANLRNKVPQQKQLVME